MGLHQCVGANTPPALYLFPLQHDQLSNLHWLALSYVLASQFIKQYYVRHVHVSGAQIQRPYASLARGFNKYTRLEALKVRGG